MILFLREGCSHRHPMLVYNRKSWIRIVLFHREFSLALTGPRTRIVEKDLSALAEILTAFAQKVSSSFAIALADPSKHGEDK